MRIGDKQQTSLECATAPRSCCCKSVTRPLPDIHYGSVSVFLYTAQRSCWRNLEIAYPPIAMRQAQLAVMSHRPGLTFMQLFYGVKVRRRTHRGIVATTRRKLDSMRVWICNETAIQPAVEVKQTLTFLSAARREVADLGFAIDVWRRAPATRSFLFNYVPTREEREGDGSAGAVCGDRTVCLALT